LAGGEPGQMKRISCTILSWTVTVSTIALI
jgi:hypothetical protein